MVNVLTEKRSTVAFRMPYKVLLEQREITKFIRPGKRIYPEHEKSYYEGQEVTARIVAEPGIDRQGIGPVFLPDFAQELKIVSIVSQPLRSLSLDDLYGLGPCLKNVQEVWLHLGIIYHIILEPENMITINKFVYL